MNMKGMVLRNSGQIKEAEQAFISALYVEDAPLKCKILINYAKTSFLKKDPVKALDLIARVFELAKTKKIPNILLGYAHFLRGQVFYHGNDEKQALTEFKKAEFYFEAGANVRGVGLACMEIARIHIKSKNLTTAWNFLRKSESYLSKLGDEERLGVTICKSIALYHTGKESEAMALLRDEVYKEKDHFGKGYYLLDEILDVYLDVRTTMIQYQSSLA